MLERYNSIEFQSSLINSIKKTFNKNIPVKFVNEESLNQTKIKKRKTKLSEKVDRMDDILTLLQVNVS